MTTPADSPAASALSPADASSLDVADEVDAIAAATLACPAVAGLHSGGWDLIATYLPGRRVSGVRIDEQRILVSVVLAYGIPVPVLEAQVRAALAPHASGRAVDVHIADVAPGPTASPDPAPAGSPRTRR